MKKYANNLIIGRPCNDQSGDRVGGKDEKKDMEFYFMHCDSVQ